MSTFNSTRTSLDDLLKDIVDGKIQLPDFQRGWIWDDEHIRSLLVSIGRSFPVGAIMLLENGGDTRFKVRPVEGVDPNGAFSDKVENLILDGQQRLTSLTQVLKLDSPVDTRDSKKQKLKRYYYIDIDRALGACPRMSFFPSSALFFENNARNTRCMSVLIVKKCLDLRKKSYSRTGS